MTQRDRFDSIRGDAPEDLDGALRAARYQAERLFESLVRMETAIKGEPRDPGWAYGTPIEVYMGPEPETMAEQWVRARCADTRPGHVKVEFAYEDPSSKAWVRRSRVRLYAPEGAETQHDPTRVGTHVPASGNISEVAPPGFLHGSVGQGHRTEEGV